MKQKEKPFDELKDGRCRASFWADKFRPKQFYFCLWKSVFGNRHARNFRISECSFLIRLLLKIAKKYDKKEYKRCMKYLKYKVRLG